MQKLVKLLLVALLLGLLSSGSIAQKSGRKPRKPTRPVVVCDIDDVPKGMVVIGYKRNSACKGGTEVLVKRPENGDIICAESPVPTGFSNATEAQGRAVGTCREGAFLITGSASPSSTKAEARSASDDEAIRRAFESRASGIQVSGEGAVVRVLSDDADGSRHQRFIVALASGQTLLITHNIDLAPRIESLATGDSVRFSGEYVWNENGGVVHWTHRDPRGRHVAGWIVHNGKTYQ
jgi:hypothetical protein